MSIFNKKETKKEKDAKITTERTNRDREILLSIKDMGFSGLIFDDMELKEEAEMCGFEREQ